MRVSTTAAARPQRRMRACRRVTRCYYYFFHIRFPFLFFFLLSEHEKNRRIRAKPGSRATDAWPRLILHCLHTYTPVARPDGPDGARKIKRKRSGNPPRRHCRWRRRRRRRRRNTTMTRAIRRGVPINRPVVYYYRRRRYCTFIIYVYRLSFFVFFTLIYGYAYEK